MPILTSAQSPVLCPPTGTPSPPRANPMNCCSSFQTPPRFHQHRSQIYMSFQVLLSPLSLRALPPQLCSQGQGRVSFCCVSPVPGPVFIVKEGFAKCQSNKCAQGEGPHREGLNGDERKNRHWAEEKRALDSRAPTSELNAQLWMGALRER